MIENLPVYVSLVFGLTTLLTAWLFFRAINASKVIMGIVLVWLTIQAFLGLSKFYTVTNTLPPRFLFLVLPPLLIISGLFLTSQGRVFIDKFDVKWLTYLHVVRIPVEIVLFWLFVYKQVPQLMTFEGRNFDILSGLTAPIIGYFGYTNKKLGRTILILWNLVCLGLLVNIVSSAVLSAPFPFQKLAFDQPNVGVLFFPFVWLPGFIVPVVLLSHLVSIRQLTKFSKT